MPPQSHDARNLDLTLGLTHRTATLTQTQAQVKPYLLHDAHSAVRVPSWCERRGNASLISRVDFSDVAAQQLAAAAASGQLW